MRIFKSVNAPVLWESFQKCDKTNFKKFLEFYFDVEIYINSTLFVFLYVLAELKQYIDKKK